MPGLFWSVFAWIWTTVLLLFLWREKWGFFSLLFKWEIFNFRVFSFENDILVYSVYSMHVSCWNRFSFCYCCLWGGPWRVRNETESRRQFIVKLVLSSSVTWKASWVRITELLIHNVLLSYLHATYTQIKGWRWWHCSKLESILKERNAKLSFRSIGELCAHSLTEKRKNSKEILDTFAWIDTIAWNWYYCYDTIAWKKKCFQLFF